MTTPSPGALTVAYQRRVENEAWVPFWSTAATAITPG